MRGFVQKRNQIGPKCERIVKGSLGRKDKGTAGVGAWPQGAWLQGRGRRGVAAGSWTSAGRRQQVAGGGEMGFAHPVPQFPHLKTSHGTR